jgi:hypothetical protein|tara:strand:+ start:457 stop:723 length:267 start_codon:yes stop_codon:yes gene_type:complete
MRRHDLVHDGKKQLSSVEKLLEKLGSVGRNEFRRTCLSTRRLFSICRVELEVIRVRVFWQKAKEKLLEDSDWFSPSWRIAATVAAGTW